MAREIEADQIEIVVGELCLKANTILREDVLKSLEKCSQKEKNGSISEKMLNILIENADIAKKKSMPLCQDTGMVAVFIEIGEDVKIIDGHVIDSINLGVKNAYEKHFFRKSIVEDPILRNNTGTNTPAVVHTDIVGGDKIKIHLMPKGFGSENKSRIAMLDPTCKKDEIIDFCVETVKKAGPDACPPYVLGIGLGGTMEHCAYLAKKALLRPINEDNPKIHIVEMEKAIKEKANKIELGVMGLGGVSTVLGVNMEEGPTHIAGCPIAVNVSCHALRSASAEI